MDVLFLNSSIYDIPSSRRVGAIVHDGAADLRLWPGPSSDRFLNEAYGAGLQKALDTEREKMGIDVLPMSGIARIHPGRLHCDFLAWVATRPSEPGTERQPAPQASALEESVLAVLKFVAERSVERVAFPALGTGPNELEPSERLALIVRAAHRYEDECFAAGKAPVVEEVLVCEKHSGTLAAAKRKVARLAKTAEVKKTPAEKEAKPKRKRAATKSATGSRRRTTAPKLDPDEVSQRRASSGTYDRTRTYGAGEWFIHPKFGVGRVEQATAEGAIEVLFEDGAQKKLIHGRA